MDITNLTINDFKNITYDKLRYRDTDRQGHVNNAVFSTFFETGRVDLLFNAGIPLLKEGCDFVIASIKLDFIKEITWPGEIRIGTKVERVGKSSLTLKQGLFQNDQCAAYAETVIVQVSRTTKRSEPLTDSALNLLNTMTGAAV